MTLKEQLEALDPNTIICLGAANGVSFIDINRAGYMKSERYMQALSEREHTKLESAVRALNDRVCRTLRKPPLHTDPKSIYYKVESTYTLDKYTKILNAWYATTKDLIKLAKDKRKELATFEPIQMREVVSVDNTIRSVIDGATIILIQGNEAGDYWLISDKYKGREIPEWKEVG